MSYVIIASRHGSFWTLALISQQEIFFFFQSSKTDELQICFRSSVVPKKPRGWSVLIIIIIIPFQFNYFFVQRENAASKQETQQGNAIFFSFAELSDDVTDGKQAATPKDFLNIIFISQCKQYFRSAPVAPHRLLLSLNPNMAWLSFFCHTQKFKVARLPQTAKKQKQDSKSCCF